MRVNAMPHRHNTSGHPPPGRGGEKAAQRGLRFEVEVTDRCALSLPIRMPRNIAFLAGIAAGLEIAVEDFNALRSDACACNITLA